VAVAGLALVPLGTGTGAGAESDRGAGGVPPQGNFVTGSGRARANLFEILPRTGGLTIPVNFGKALVTYQGLSATATSGGVKRPSQNSAEGDCGGAQPPGGGGGGAGGGGAGGGETPAPPGGGNKGPSTSFPFVSTLTVSTGDKDAEKGRQMDQGSFPAGSPVSGSLEHQEVAATAAPWGRALTTSGRLAFGPVVEVVHGRTEATAGVIDDKAREAHAVTTIDRLSLFNGLVVLGDVRWEATQRTGEGQRADGAFTVGSVLFQGKPLPAPPGPPATVLPGGSPPTLPDPLAALNTALAPSGIAIEAPHFDTAGGVARVSPMSVRFADSTLGRVVLGPVVGDLQPLRDPVVGGLLALSCDFGTAVTVADVATSILTGSGGLSFDFGGVTATTEGEQYANPLAGGPGEGDSGLGGDLGALPELGSTPGPSAALSGPVGDTGSTAGSPSDLSAPLGDAGTAAGSGSPAGGGPGGSLGASPPGGESAFAGSGGLLAPASRHVPGRTGGTAVAVAALALLTVAALAAADAFHLRRASRSIP
jgi:hypothetical protein